MCPAQQRAGPVVVRVEAHPVAPGLQHGSSRPFHDGRPSGAHPAERHDEDPRAGHEVGHCHHRRDRANARLVDAKRHARRPAGGSGPRHDKLAHDRPGHFERPRRNPEFAAARLRARGRGRATGWARRHRRCGEGEDGHGRQNPEGSLVRVRHAFGIGRRAESLKPSTGMQTAGPPNYLGSLEFLDERRVGFAKALGDRNLRAPAKLPAGKADVQAAVL